MSKLESTINTKLAKQLHEIINEIQSNSLVTDLLVQWSRYVQMPSPCYSEKTIIDLMGGGDCHTSLFDAIYDSIRTCDETGFDLNTREMRARADAVFEHRESCQEIFYECEWKHPEFHWVGR